MARILGLVVTVLAMLAPLSRPVLAHPHVWIDLQSALVVDDSGRVIALRQEWLFDDFYSLFVLQGLQGDKDDLQKALRDLARENLKNLEEYGYFTDIRVDGARVNYATVTDYEMEQRGSRLWMQFTVPLKEPVDPKTRSLRFAVYDPTYYIEIVYAKGATVALESLAAAGCQASIKQPSPSEEAVGLAASLDRTESAGDTLGEMFAEWVDLQCR